MRSLARLAMLALCVALTGVAFADDDNSIPISDVRSPGVLHGGPAIPHKAGGDTIVLIGPAHLNPEAIGTFQDAGGQPHWNGWTTLDRTVPDTTDTSWHVSTYLAINGTYSAYCGDETIPSCGGGDPVGGYGNSWRKILKWGLTVADPGQSTNITVDFAYDIDTEDGYDWGVLARERENEEWERIWQLSGDTTGVVSVPITYDPGEYVGAGDDEIGVWFMGESDVGWSDEDCDYPTAGLWRIDDVTITADNPATVASHDFEDGTLGPFERFFLSPFGNFAHILAGLGDPDPCVANTSPQITFIDDGVVQPATGGTPAVSPQHMYAGGWALNFSGGLTFSPWRRLDNYVTSPAIPWPQGGYEGARFGFTYMLDSPFLAGVALFPMSWFVRSTDGDAASIEEAEWVHAPELYFGGPYYGRRFWDVSGYLVPGCTHVQVAVGTREYKTVWGLIVDKSTPSPFYDNIRLEAFPVGGHSLTAQTMHLAGDGFPEIGIVDTADLSRNSIRFDTAGNISPTNQEHYHNGDSLTVDAVALRDGAALTGRPRFHYLLERNSLFDPYRMSGLPDSGMIVMDTTYTPTGTPVADRYNVDLPDTGFLFPGDVLHYYFEVEDAIGGFGGADPRSTLLPADIAGFGNFDDLLAWPSDFTMRGLPSLAEPSPGTFRVPPVLYWDDAESEAFGIRDEWESAFRLIGTFLSGDFDIYTARAPSSNVGSGLGGHATVDQLAWYRDLVYSSGALTSFTLSDGSWADGGGDDIGLLEDWLDLGGRDIFLSGDHLARDLNGSAQAFLHDRLQVDFVDDSHRDLLGGQLAPRVLRAPADTVLVTVFSWLAHGGCPSLLEFDLVTPRAGGERLAEFGAPDGNPGGYPYSPLTMATHASGSRVVSMTMDLARVHTDTDEGSKLDSSLPARARILSSVLRTFGNDYVGHPMSVPAATAFTVAAGPNPFNPATEIAYSIKAPGHLALKIYNVRGELVRTLIDAPVETGGRAVWDGSDAGGRRVASGVYFYVARMGRELRTGKLALIQ